MSQNKFYNDFDHIRDLLGLDSAITENWFDDYENSFKFQCHERPTIGKYYDVYLELSKGADMNNNLFNDIILIGLNLKDLTGKYVYTVPLSSRNNTKAISLQENIIISNYTQNSLKKYAKTKSVDIPLPPKEENDFRNYMEVLCSVLMQIMFSNSKNIGSKLNQIGKGIQILSLPYTGKDRYLNFTFEFSKTIRKTAKNHLWKSIISVILIKAFVVHAKKKSKKVKNFLEWQIMINIEDQLDIYKMNVSNIIYKCLKISEDKTCGICLEKINVFNKKQFGLIENCCHIYCYDCINVWLNQSLDKNCPQCRKPIGSIKASFNYIEDKIKKKNFFNISTWVKDNQSRVSSFF